MSVDPLAQAHPAVAVFLAFVFGPFAYVYTLELARMAAAITIQVGLLVGYAIGVVHLFQGGFKVTSLAGGALDQALVASPAILLGAGALAIAMNLVVAVDLAWRISQARNSR